MARNFTKNSTDESEARGPDLVAWHVAEKGAKGFWTRIGAAWSHKDGEGLTLQLDLVPVAGGRIVLRAPGKADGDEGRA